jgi:hypothetical protein
MRRIQGQIDFGFIYAEVKDSYADNGNVSIPPPVILEMMWKPDRTFRGLEKEVNDGTFKSLPG